MSNGQIPSQVILCANNEGQNWSLVGFDDNGGHYATPQALSVPPFGAGVTYPLASKGANNLCLMFSATAILTGITSIAVLLILQNNTQWWLFTGDTSLWSLDQANSKVTCGVS